MTSAVDTLLLDLDDTLYDYVPAEKLARAATLAVVARDLEISEADAGALFVRSRAAVKARLGHRGSAHARLLYFADVVHLAGRPSALVHVRGWDRLFWSTLIGGANLRPGALPLLRGFRARGGKVAIVTDLTLDPQLQKLEAFGLFGLVDALVASEEVPDDKPATRAFELALERLGVPLAAAPSRCLVVGDSDAKDGAAARTLGVRFFHVASSEPGATGGTLEALAQELGVS